MHRTSSRYDVRFDLPPGCTQLHQSYISLYVCPLAHALWRRNGGIHAAHAQRARSLANSFARCDSTLKWLSAQPGLRSSSLLSAVSSLPYCTSSGVAPPAELALPPTGTAAYRYCRLPGANLLNAAAAIAPSSAAAAAAVSAAAKVGKLFAEAAAHPHRL